MLDDDIIHRIRCECATTQLINIKCTVNGLESYMNNLFTSRYDKDNLSEHLSEIIYHLECIIDDLSCQGHVDKRS